MCTESPWSIRLARQVYEVRGFPTPDDMLFIGDYPAATLFSRKIICNNGHGQHMSLW